VHQVVKGGLGARVLLEGGGEDGGVGRVDCGDDGEVVLEFEEVGWGRGDGVVEGVREGGVVGAEGEFVDGVGKVEC